MRKIAILAFAAASMVAGPALAQPEKPVLSQPRADGIICFMTSRGLRCVWPA